MISRTGWVAVGTALGALVLAAYTLDLLLLVGATAVFAGLAGEILLFHAEPPGPERTPFTVHRAETPRVLSPGAELNGQITVIYDGPRAVRAEVVDLLPGTLPIVAGRPSLRRWFAPGRSVALGYRLRAGDRGSHLMGPVAVTVESPHGLAWAQWTVPDSERPLRVVPPAPIERSHRIGPALFTRMQGRLALRHRGYGTEFRSLRPYQLSDDIRHVAWKRSRPGQWYVREFEQESRQDFVLLLDISPAMLAGVPGENALDRAIEAASLVTAAVARSGEDRVGLMTATDRPRQWLRPHRGEYHFRLIAENLAYLRPVEGIFNLGSALERLETRLRTNTHVLAFTALDGPLEGIHRTHARFRAHGHHLYLFPPNRAGFYPPLPPGHPGAIALGWAEQEEHERLEQRTSELRGVGIPIFPYDRRGATNQVLSTYGQLRAWGMA
ncbi:MAG: DUF58 domain-containing protein [Thermoplasmata archaeon]